MTFEVPQTTSRILEDIMNLEQDFKYNLNLLRIKDQEIERCKIVNENLQKELNKVVFESKELSKKNAQLLHEFEALKRERRKDKEAFDMKINLEESERRKNEEIFGNKLRQKNDFMQIISEMKINEHKYKDLILKYETQIAEQTRNCANFQAKYTNLIEENVALSNKIKDINARHVSEICMYKNELEKSSYEISVLKKEITTIKKDYKAYLNSQNKLVKENNELQVKILTLSQKYKECNGENDKLKENMKIMEIKYDGLKESYNSLEKQNEILKKRKSDDSNESLLKQNRIMKEIIKSFRNKRDNENI